MTDLDRLVELLTDKRRILVFTGAGISTQSGIPDFRGPQGIWKRRQPVYYDEFLASEDKRLEYWDYKLEGYQAFSDARPNPAHFAVTRLQEAGRVLALVTQNIDGLHQRAGSAPDSVIEIHGTNAQTECLSCNRRADPEPAMRYFEQHKETPKCEACGGLLKLATISFGQALDQEVLARAAGATRLADLVLALGSTLSVHPAASIPLMAAQRGAPYVIINQGETDHDRQATLKLDGDVSELLPAAVERVLAN